MGEKKYKKVIVDTYALLAIVYNEVGEKARNVVDKIRRREVVGLIHRL